MKVCRFCNYPIIRGTIKVCCKCKAIYHPECWHVNGHCANEGCLSTEADTIKPQTKSVKDEVTEKEIPSDTAITNKEKSNNYKTNPMDTKTKIMTKSFLKRLRWKRVGLIVIIIPAIIIILFLLFTLASSVFGFGKDKKLFSSGVKKLEQNKYQEAAQDFEEVLKLNPKYPEIKTKLLEDYRKLLNQLKDENKYNEAMKILQKIAALSNQEQIKQDMIDLYLQWGDYLLSQKSYQPATEKFEKVLEMDKTDSKAKEKRTQTLISMLYDMEYETTPDQFKLIISDKDCRNKIQSDGIKLYSAQCQMLKTDINNNGFKDIIVAGEDADSIAAGIEIYKINSGKAELVTVVDTTGYYLNKIGTIDLNSDKRHEVFSDWSRPKSTKLGFTILLFSKGKEIAYRNSNKISDSPLIFEDINKNGTLNIIAGQTCEGIKIDGEDYLFPYIYKLENYEFVDVSNQYADYYKKIYISSLEKKLKSLPETDDYVKKANYEGTIMAAIEKLYDIIGLQYDSKSGGKGPEETIQENFDYINRHEFYKAYLLRSARRRKETSFQNFYNLWRDNISIKVEEVTLVEKNENKAQVRAVFEATEQVKLNETKSQHYKGNYYLIKEFDLWYLDDSKVIQ